MKEDILEQLVDDYLQSNGYLTRHNIKYRLNNHGNHSDIDVIGYNPKKHGPDRVWAVNCKSWMGGFNAESWIKNLEKNKIVAGRDAWRFFRELIVEEWTNAFVDAIEDTTGTREFTHVTAATAIRGDRTTWINCPLFANNLGNKIQIKMMDLPEIIQHHQQNIPNAVASTNIGRILQLFHAAGVYCESPRTDGKSKS